MEEIEVKHEETEKMERSFSFLLEQHPYSVQFDTY